MLLVSTSSKRNNDEICHGDGQPVSWIKKVMEANGLVANGPMRIVTTDFTSDAYAFDVVQVVQRATDPVGAPPARRCPCVWKARSATSNSRRVGSPMTTYTGPSPGLAARARPVARLGHDPWQPTPRIVRSRNILGGISTMLDEDAQFNVYWPLK